MHVLLVYVLLNEELLWAKLKAADAQQVIVELVPETPKPRPPNPPPPQIDETKPEPPKAEAPKPEAPKPEAVEPPSLTVPQLLPGRLAERSSVPHPASRNGAGGEGQALAMSSGPGFTLLPKEQTKAGRPGSTGQEGPELTQSEQDVILAQVLKYWNVNFHAPEAHGLVLEGVFYVQADGTLASPFNKNDPWNPAAVVRGYAELARAGTSFRKDAMDGFLLALRLCQPLQLPSSKGAWPRKIVIRFAFDSL
ncbi:MAG TPA: hypothetical protein VN809_12130 [Telmatospirillum sp.]|nr:hypothetical protein [Telmatospirillum sp.]